MTRVQTIQSYALKSERLRFWFVWGGGTGTGFGIPLIISSVRSS